LTPKRVIANPGEITSGGMFQQIADAFIIEFPENPVQSIVPHNVLQKIEKNTPRSLHNGILLSREIYHYDRFSRASPFL
jgi:hypothetical protein